MSPGLAVEQAMLTALLADAPLLGLLGGPHVYAELPRGEPQLHVAFTASETRDWSVTDAKAHEHFITLEVTTDERGRAAALAICARIECCLDNVHLPLEGHHLVNLRLVFWSVSRTARKTFGASLRFRAATEPLEP